jgi:hypothetical protein
MLAMVGLAWAKDREPEALQLALSLPSAPDVEWNGLPTTPRSMRLGQCHPRFKGEDESGETDDGWLTTRCTLSRRCVELEVTFVPAHYPEHLPEELSCPLGRYNVTIAVLPEPPLYVDPGELSLSLEGVAPLRLPTVDDDGSAQSTKDFALPPGVPWVQARALLKDTAGATWKPGACEVVPGEPALLRVHFEHTMQGEGTCTVPDGNGEQRILRFRREDVPAAAP